MKQIFSVLMVFCWLGLFPVMANAAIQDVNPGCKIAWDQPTIPDPENAGQQIGAWDKAGDLKGFEVGMAETQAWPASPFVFEETSMREVLCDAIGANALGEHWVGVLAFDDSLNRSAPAWINFQVVEHDTMAPSPVTKYCMSGMLKGQVVETCLIVDSP